MTTTDTTTALPTQNPEWGFYGTIGRAGMPADLAWEFASNAIAAATGADDPNDYGPEGVRDWLDSRDGRHFADMVADLHERLWSKEGNPMANAIEHAIRKYQSWTIGPRTENEIGIPAGMPYLEGWVRHYAILAEMAESGTSLGGEPPAA